MTSAELHGVIAAIVTPFDDRDRLDEAALRRVARHAIDGGSDAIMTAGGTGEFPHLTREEKRLVAQWVVEESAGRVPVIAGTAACSTREAVELCGDAAAAGAAAVILTPPYYFPLPDRSLYQHFAVVARESPISVVVYNNPLYTGNDLKPALIAEMAAFPNVIGLKQSNSDLGALVEIIRLVGSRISLCTGIDSQFYPALCVGAQGIFSTAACVIPREMATIYRAFRTGDHATALREHMRVQELNRFFEYDPGYVAPCKAALAMLGVEAGSVRPPLPGLTPEEREGIREALADLGYSVRNATGMSAQT
jgi:4-hydroxy-tetrahydrodipicolinate synthase